GGGVGGGLGWGGTGGAGMGWRGGGRGARGGRGRGRRRIARRRTRHGRKIKRGSGLATAGSADVLVGHDGRLIPGRRQRPARRIARVSSRPERAGGSRRSGILARIERIPASASTSPAGWRERTGRSRRRRHRLRTRSAIVLQ